MSTFICHRLRSFARHAPRRFFDLALSAVKKRLAMLSDWIDWPGQLPSLRLAQIHSFLAPHTGCSVNVSKELGTSL